MKKTLYLQQKWVYPIKSRFLTLFGDVKISKYPFFISYQPTSFRIKGEDTRTIINLLQVGDLVLRGYDDYLDGYFIPKGLSGCSHSGIYIGDGQMIHAIAEGTLQTDIIDFCRTDKIIILRPNSGQTNAIQRAKQCLAEHKPYDFNFDKGTDKFYCHKLTAYCYPDLEIKRMSEKMLGLISSPPVFLADSFFINPNFEHIYPL